MKFKVFVQQYVEEIAELKIEAATPEEAAEIAKEMHRKGEIEMWRDGDDVVAGAAAKVDEGVYLVEDNAGQEVWERH